MQKLFRRLQQFIFARLPVMSLRTWVIMLFLFLFIGTITIILTIRSISHKQDIKYASLEVMKYAADKVLAELDNVMMPVESITSITAKLFKQQVLNLNNIPQVKEYLFNLASSLAFVNGVFYGDLEGNMLFAELEGNITRIDQYQHNANPPILTSTYVDLNGNIIKKIVINNPDSYDPRARPWFKKAIQNNAKIWSGAYVSKLSIQQNTPTPHYYLMFVNAIPISVGTTLQGVFGIDVILKAMNEFIEQQQVASNGISFIISGDEDLIAYSKKRIAYLTGYQIRSDNTLKLVRLSDERVPIIYDSLNYYKKTGRNEFIFTYRGKHYLIYYIQNAQLKDLNWLVGVIIPEKDFIARVQREYIISLIISLIAIILGINLFSLLITKLLSPSKKLVAETERIKNFELDHVLMISSKIKEIIQLTNAINTMKTGLKHFQKYVPEGLIKQLIASGEDIRVGGIKRDLVVFFSDIENFTRMSEKLDPTQLTIQLCEYFDTISQIILQEHGTIDKYIGDAIMVFWGAPIKEHHPCTHAANAALSIKRTLQELNTKWQNEGKPLMKTRIGIHSGVAIVGNIGSKERVNYTAIGDSINIANRLEGINKVYGSQICVSEIVYKIIQDQFLFRLLDYLAVRGREKKIFIYELLGDLNTTLPFDLKSYNETFMKAFIAYQARDWQQAIIYFERCLEIYPEDHLALIFIDRCRRRSIS